MIGGNIELTLQTKTTVKDEIGARVATWQSVQILNGWLDFVSGDARRVNFDAKIEETTHVFICDYVALASQLETENCRAIVKGQVYDVLLIDNPMEMNRQLEIYLKFTGGQ